MYGDMYNVRGGETFGSYDTETRTKPTLDEDRFLDTYNLMVNINSPQGNKICRMSS